MNDETKLKSGAVLSMGMPPFEEASALLDALVVDLKAVNIDLGNLGEYMAKDGDVGELLKDARFVNTLKNAVCQLLGSKAFKAALFDCMARSTLNGEKITRTTFEEHRGDYLPVAWEVTRFTLIPFFADLDLSFLKSTGAPNVSPK